MVETIIAIVVGFIIWNLRKGFYSQSEVWKEQVDIRTTDSKADLQEDYKNLHTRIIDIKKSNDGKWFSMKDIDEVMKHDS